MTERYKLPDALGGGEYEADDRYRVGGCVAFVLGAGVVYVARNLLTPVKPPTPEEPEPGLYMLGDWLAFRRPGDIDLSRWFAISMAVDDSGDWDDWEALWRMAGGPDVTITRLVAERVETVPLPWALNANECYVEVELTGLGQVSFGLTSDNDDVHVALRPSLAEEIGRVLIAAARATASRAES